jgi:beta-glucosidase
MLNITPHRRRIITMPTTIETLIQQMTLEEKAAMCTGEAPWRTLAVERLGIPAMVLSDGPHGVRRATDLDSMITPSLPATCFPVAVALASTWDQALLYEMGHALAEECIALGVDVLLGPGINMKRSPLCGRNFEYFAEDHLVAGQLSASLIQGIQSKGIGTSLKHFAVNNQETLRFTVDAIVDERTLHEIYLTGFEIAVKQGNPWTVMCAYNRVNGYYASESEYLLTTVLRDQWGYDGFVVSDWGAVHDRVPALKAGLDLQMPGPAASSVQQVVAAVNAGTLDEAILNRSVERLLRINERAQATPKGTGEIAIDAHHALARKIAAEGLVLLKNDHDLLPLSGSETLAVIGQGALVPAYQGGGSSHINATRVDQPLELLRQEAEINFAVGDGNSIEGDQVRIAEAVEVAKYADIALLFIALPSQIESEGYDRRDLNLTPQQVALIQAVAAVQPRTVVVLNNGSAVNLAPWIDAVPAVLEAWLPGQAGAGAIMDVLFGRVNPSGKLTETFPLALSDTPPYLNFPGENGQVRYGEGIFIGYRGYEATNRPVLFPFGYGMSYTEFAYSNLRVSQTNFTVEDTLEVAVDITNTGKRAGKEVVQLYIHDAASRLRRPVKELKGFAKVALEAGETKTVTLALDSRAFSYYDPDYSRWLAEAGEFEILVGSSSAHIHLHQTITMTAGTVLPSRLHLESTLGDWLDDPKGAPMVEPVFQMMMGSDDPTGGDKSLGIDMRTFFRDLPLQVMFSFQGGGLQLDPNDMVRDMLAQVRAE